ncbi:hypothetical protein F01_190014 [Burkholderia cenocepacia]|nr:hypothetical protein F01_190014 [Burkholderia cenocepacia]
MRDFNVRTRLRRTNPAPAAHVSLRCNTFANARDTGELHKIGDCPDLLPGYFGVLYAPS